MPVALQDVRPYGVANEADNDGSTLGGAVDTIKLKPPFRDVAGPLQGISSDAGDVGTFVLAVFGWDATYNIITDSVAPTGLTPALFAVTTFAQLLRGNINNNAALGDVAIMAQTPVNSGTAQSGTATSIVLDPGASAVDRFYSSMIIRLTGGTGAGQIRQIIFYDGTLQEAIVDKPWGTDPDNTTTYEISGGFYFPVSPNRVKQPRRLFYDGASPAVIQPTKIIYDKFFFRNDHATDTANSVSVQLDSDPTALIEFGLAAAINDSLTTPDRVTAPTGITFGTTPVSVPGGSLGPGDAIGVWVRITLAPAAPAIVDVTDRFSITWTP